MLFIDHFEVDSCHSATQRITRCATALFCRTQENLIAPAADTEEDSDLLTLSGIFNSARGHVTNSKPARDRAAGMTCAGEY